MRICKQACNLNPENVLCALTTRTEPAYESTFIDPPETPAHQFAVKAFKHAIFGTPAPEDLNNAARKFETKAKITALNAKFPELPAPRNDDPLLSPRNEGTAF